MLYLALVLLTTPGCDDAAGPGKDPVRDTDTVVDDTIAVDDTTDTTTETDDTTDQPAPALVVCPGAVEVPSEGTCAVSGSGAAAMLRGTILGGATVYVGGALRMDGGEITCVGCDCDDAGATVLSCGHAVVSPGLINAHDHVTYDEAAPSAATNRRFDHRHDWRGGAVTVPSNPHGVDGARWTEVRQLLAGTTAIFGSGSAPGLLRNLDASSEAGDGLQSARYETFPLGDSDRRFHGECDWDYGRTSFAVQASTYVPHVAEGIDDYAAAEFTCQSQPEGGERDYLGSNTAFIHGVGLTATDYDRMASAGTGLVWSPRSNISLYGQTAQVTLFDRLGGRIALGTDWTATGSASALRELACAAQLNEAQYGGYFTDEALWRMVTADAAAVLGQPRLGALEVGRLADVSVFRATEGQTYDAVVGALPDDVALVLRAGTPLFGEAALVAGLGAACEAVDVCGVPSAVCLEGSGTTWASLSAGLADAYPAILCGVPADEPTCHPSRPDAYDGPTANDLDGDGLIDADDLCPALFSPLRPLDQGVQPDNDGDGVGDACDETPLGADLDGDGEPNASDNCPYLENDQADADGDDRGDVCDACADLSNPAGLCPPVAATLGAVRTGEVAVGARVALEGTVTAVATGFVWIQDGQTVGLRVVASATVSVGDRVRVDGVVASFFDELQLVSERVTVLGPGAPPAPVELSPEEAASEAWEGMLVRLVSGEVTDPAFTCPACTDPGLYEVGGPAGVVVDPRIYVDADWDARRGTPPPITGVMSYKWGLRLLFPRSAADL